MSYRVAVMRPVKKGGVQSEGYRVGNVSTKVYHFATYAEVLKYLNDDTLPTPVVVNISERD